MDKNTTPKCSLKQPKPERRYLCSLDPVYSICEQDFCQYPVYNAMQETLETMSDVMARMFGSLRRNTQIGLVYDSKFLNVKKE